MHMKAGDHDYIWEVAIKKIAEERIRCITHSELYLESLNTIKEIWRRKGVSVEVKHSTGDIDKGEPIIEVKVIVPSRNYPSDIISSLVRDIERHLLVWCQKSSP